MSNDNQNPDTQLAVLPPQALARKITAEAWNALTELYDGASPQMIGLVSDYCLARRLDPLKKPVHIVPVWSSRRKMMVETIWPSIAETRITAMRTGKFGGLDETKWGQNVTQDVGNAKGFTYPEWAQVTVYRMVDGAKCAFPGPRVYWLESYATKGKDDYTPNAMWSKRTWGQLEKSAEAAALRRAFPEELGGIATAEEVHGRILDEDLVNVTHSAQAALPDGNGEVRRAAVPGKLPKGAAALEAPAPASSVTVAPAEPPANVPRGTETPAATPTEASNQASDQGTAAAGDSGGESKKRVRRSKEQIAADAEKAREAALSPPPAENPKTEPTPPDAQPSAAAEPAPASTPPARTPAPAASEWPKVVTATVDECVVKESKNPQAKYPKFKVCLLGGAEVMLAGQRIGVRQLGRIIFDPAIPELEPFTEVSDKPVEFTIAEVPSAANPQLMNRMIIRAETPTDI